MNERYHIDRAAIQWGAVPVDLLFSYGRVESFPFLIVRLGSGGKEGIGEVLLHPNPFMEALLPSLLGRDARRLDALLPAVGEDVERILCEAVSIALYDLVGQCSGLPLHALLGGKQRDRVPLMPCIFPTNAEEAGTKAAAFFAAGYGALKMKLVGELAEDTARVEAVRTAAPEGAVLQGDANEGYKTIDTARTAIKQLGDAGLDIFEDPLKGGVSEYRQLLGTGGAKVMVDALSRRTEDLIQVLRQEAADVVGIHPDQPGSLSRVMNHTRLAQAFNMPVVIGGTGYTGVGSAAYQHVTAVVSAEGPCGELGGAFDHGMPYGVVRQPLPMQNGFVTIPDTPGLGVSIDEDALSRLEQGRKEWC